MTLHRTAEDAPWLDAGAAARLEQRIGRAVRRARSRGAGVLASVSAPTTRLSDPMATVAASRQRAEPWFGLKQPDREGLALAGVGCVLEIEAAGPDRFAAVAERWRELRAHAECDSLD